MVLVVAASIRKCIGYHNATNNTSDDGATQVHGNVCSVVSGESSQKSHTSANPSRV